MKTVNNFLVKFKIQFQPILWKEMLVVKVERLDFFSIAVSEHSFIQPFQKASNVALAGIAPVLVHAPSLLNQTFVYKARN
jgi:hypothetical protein